MSEQTIQLEEQDNKGRAFIGVPRQVLAEMTYSRAGAHLIIIDHTEVGESLRGQGIGRQLLATIVTMAREQQAKILPLCPYAKSVFDKETTIQDVLR